MNTFDEFNISNDQLPFFIPEELLEGHGLKLYVFKDPLLERPRIKAVTKNQVGVYVWLGKRANNVALRPPLVLFEKEAAFLPACLTHYNIYVGCAHGDLYTRIIHYFHNHSSKTSPMIRYLKAEGGVSHTNLLVFVISGSERVPISVIGGLEYYFMQKLNPDINSNFYSLVPSKSHLGWRIYVYNQSKSKLLYRFKSFSSLVRSTSTKHDTIKKHIESETLLLGAFHVSLKPLPGVSDTPSCTEQSFIELAKKTRDAYIAKPGGLHGKNKCKAVYIYNAEKTKLLRVFPSKDYLESIAKISHRSVNKYVKSGAKFLNSFIISSHPLSGISQKSTCTEAAFIKLAAKARKDSRGCKVLAANLINPNLTKTFVTRILLAKHFEISLSTVALHLKTGKTFRDEWKFVRLQRR